VAGIWALHFVHDSSGRILVMQLHGPRIWNLWFDKTPDTANRPAEKPEGSSSRISTPRAA
jgi:hypothetical protein